MLKRFWKPETGIFLGIWLVLMVGGRSRFFHDPGTFWHTVVGEQMLSSGMLIETDSFTFTFAGRPWIAHQWLGECVMALVHRLDGLDSLLVVTVTLLSCLYTWAASRLMCSGLHWLPAIVLTALAIAASSSHFHIRPHIGTMLLLGCTYAFLCDVGSGRSRVGRLAWLVPLFILWTNIHGGMLGGWCTLALAAGCWCLARVVGVRSPVTDRRQMLLLGVIVLACGLTAFVNPYGLQLPMTWLEIMHADLPQIIQEHAPLNPAKPDGWIVLLFGGVYVFVLVGVLPRSPRVTWLIPLVWLYLAYSRIRHAPLFSITAIIALADMLPHTRWAAWLARPGSDLFRFPEATAEAGARRFDARPALLPLALILTAFVLQSSQITVPVLGHGWARLDPDYWPVELLPELTQYQNERPEKGARIFNDYLYGGFLIYYTPGYRVFVDDRCELFGDGWLVDFVEAERGRNTVEHLKEWQQEYGPIDFALTRTGSPFDEYFGSAGDWTLVKRTDTATFYRHSR